MTAETHTGEHSSAGNSSYAVPLVLAVLLVWRWLLPPENVLLGGTLWIAQCSLLLPVLLWRKTDSGLVWGPLDTGLWIIVLGHWVSYAWMLSAGGNLRSGLNLCWEWTAIGTTVFVLRQAVRDQMDRQDLLRLLIVLGVSFAAIGLWQHYVSFRTTTEEYQRLISQYDALIAKAESIGLSRLEQREYHRLNIQMQELDIPLQGPAREVFERRLADNREPVGRWALANSLGGLLAVTLILTIPGIFASGRARWWSVLMLIPVAVCLWKTHSRTAWVGAFVGIYFYALRKFSPSERFYRRFAIGSLIAGTVLGAVMAGWGLMRLDRIDVESHYALRSLQFRLQYWGGSLAMLREAPVFGSGPGNFREHYLVHKLPASSEQIADPHNSFLDLWSNGGLAALAGGLLITFVALQRLVKFDRVPADSAQAPVSETFLSSPWMLGAELAVLGMFLFTLLTTGEFDKELLAVLVGLPFLDMALQRIVGRDQLDVTLLAAVALGVHLLGAGGTEMPGIILSGSVLLVLAGNPGSCCASSVVKRVLIVGFSLSLAAGMGQSTTIPTELARRSMQTGWDKWPSEGDVTPSREAFQEAALRDPHDPEPWRLLAQLEYQSWLQDPETPEQFDRAIEAWNESARRDPRSSKDDFHRADAYWTRYQQDETAEFAREAVSWYERADAKRPHDERILSQLAFAAEAAGMNQKSRNAAESAIEIDELSRKYGHWEKQLPSETLERLKSLIAQ